MNFVFDEKLIILIGLGVIIISVLFRDKIEYTFSLKKWIILAVVGILIYLLWREPHSPFRRYGIPALSMFGLLIMWTW